MPSSPRPATLRSTKTRVLTARPGILPRHPFEYVLAADEVGLYLLSSSVRCLDFKPLALALLDAVDAPADLFEEMTERLRAAYTRHGALATWHDVAGELTDLDAMGWLLNVLRFNGTLAASLTGALVLELQRELSRTLLSTGRADLPNLRIDLPPTHSTEWASDTVLSAACLSLVDEIRQAGRNVQLTRLGAVRADISTTAVVG